MNSNDNIVNGYLTQLHLQKPFLGADYMIPLTRDQMKRRMILGY